MFGLGRDAVGKRMSTSGDDLDIEIVGLMQDAKYSDVKVEVPPLFILPYRQVDRAASMTLYVRTAIDPNQFIGTIQPLVARLDPNLPVNELRTLPEQVRESVFLDRLMSTLAASFAALATLLAAVGLYGVLAQLVGGRTQELGLRMALGARPSDVLGWVLGRGLRLTVVGVVIGVAGAAVAARSARSMLFGVEPLDVATYIGTTVVLLLVALAGCSSGGDDDVIDAISIDVAGLRQLQLAQHGEPRRQPFRRHQCPFFARWCRQNGTLGQLTLNGNSQSRRLNR